MTPRAIEPGPSRRGPILIPGLPVLPPNVERHPIPGGGTRTLTLDAGDEVTVIDREGRQPCELVVFDAASGRSDPALIGARSSGGPHGIRVALEAPAPSAKRVRDALAARGLDLGRAAAVHLFGGESRAGASASFVATAPATLVAGAPGGPMPVDGQCPPTEIVLYVRRESRTSAKPGDGPPPPLADPLLDLNIQPGTARGYEIKAGQLIQIVDVKGRECTDFQAFSLRALDRGLERELDPTTTRTLMGSLYPGPGLYSKYYTVDHEPLLELVQDTCGRHDSFGLACTARYYEDLGYPGHANCSDNINAEAERFDIRPRAGWPAINFFFNTMLDDANAIGMNDPWSRPGDFVLMRALTDLVCFSTACPCDVDPANGWNPTDVQVRVYDRNEDFKPATGFRMTADADVRMTKNTGFHDCFAAHTRSFVEYNGFWLAQDFPAHGAIGEYWACRERAAVMDLSPLRKYEVLGPDAEALLQRCVTRDVRRLAVGQVVYTAMCYEHGGMIDDGTVFRLGDNNFRWIGGSDQSGLWLREQAERRGLDAWVKTSTDQTREHRGAGSEEPGDPGADPLDRPDPADRLRARLVPVHGCPPRRLPRHGPWSCPAPDTPASSGTSCSPPQGRTDPVRRGDDGGRAVRIAPFGLGALDMVRIEAGLVFAGREFSDRTDPFEAGIGFTVPLKSKTDDFIGREALVRRKAHPVQRLAGLDLEGGVVPSAGDCVRVGRAQVGEITSAVRVPHPRQGHRARPHGHDPRRARRCGRGRPARRPPEAYPGAGRPLPSLRSRETAGARRLRLTPDRPHRPPCPRAAPARHPAGRPGAAFLAAPGIPSLPPSCSIQRPRSADADQASRAIGYRETALSPAGDGHRAWRYSKYGTSRAASAASPPSPTSPSLSRRTRSAASSARTARAKPPRST